MKVSGSSIAAYYAGNAVLALDRKVEQQSQEAAQQRLLQFKRSQPLSEQVLEGELLNKGKQQAQADAEGGGAGTQNHAAQPPLSSVPSNNPAIRQYQATAQLDGFSSSGSHHRLDVYA